MSTDEEGRKKQLENDLHNLYNTEGLVLIGGVQDKNRANNIQMMFFKVDVNNPGIKSAVNYNPEVRVKEETDLDKAALEELLNELQLDSNSNLRSIMTFEDSKKWHLIITQ